MATTIKLKNGSGAPLAGDLVQGEPAFDLTNKRLYTENASGTVIEVGTNPTSLTTGTFTSTGIDDNATSTAITIDSSGDVGFNTASPNLHGWAKAVTLDTATNAGYELGQSGTKYGAFALQADGRVQITNFTANPLTFQTNNTEQMRIDSSGNVGIGTASPSTSLDVVRAGAMPLRVQSTSGTECQINMVNTGGNVQLEAHSGNFNIDADAVGIGTTSPASLLDIQGAGAAATSPSVTATTGTNYIGWKSVNTGGSFWTAIDNSTGSAFGTNTSYARVLWSNGAYPMVFSTNSTERMRIDSSGNVGIGTTSPSELLDVGDHTTTGIRNIRISQRTATGAQTYGGLEFFFDNSAGTTGVNAAIKYAAGPLRNDGELTFHTGASASISERLRIDHNGNVGIGTTSPSRTFVVSNNGGDGIELDYGSGSSFVQSYNRATASYLPLDLFASEIHFHSGSSSTERMRIDSSGRVGSGTTNPAYKLDIYGDSSSNVDVLHLLNENVTSGNSVGVMFENYSGGGLNQGRIKYLNSGSNNSNSFVFEQEINGVNGLQETMRIDSSGNVGIGTTNPSIYGKTALVQTTNASTGGLAIVDSTSAQSAKLWCDTTNAYLSSGNTGADPLILNAGGGNVGIGTTSPAYPMHVNGKAYSTQFVGVNGSASAPSYAFGNDEDCGMFRPSTNQVGFATNATERMRIDSSGNLLVGTSSFGGNSARFQAVRNNSGAIGYFEIDNSGGSQNAIDITNAANAAFVPLRFWVNGYGTGSLVGSISCTTSGTAFNATSDVRVKENIVDAPAGNIDAIRVRSFDWKADGTHQPYGMIAQELVEVAPEAVTQGETEEDMWGVDYSKLVPMMIKEIQDLRARVAQLEGA